MTPPTTAGRWPSPCTTGEGVWGTADPISVTGAAGAILTREHLWAPSSGQSLETFLVISTVGAAHPLGGAWDAATCPTAPRTPLEGRSAQRLQCFRPGGWHVVRSEPLGLKPQTWPWGGSRGDRRHLYHLEKPLCFWAFLLRAVCL